MGVTGRANHAVLEGGGAIVHKAVPEFIDPCFRENKPKTLVFSHWKRAFWAKTVSIILGTGRVSIKHQTRRHLLLVSL